MQKIAHSETEKDNTRAVVFVIYVDADEHSDQVTLRVTKMFAKNQKVKKIQVYENKLLIRLFKRQHLKTVRNFYKDTNKIIDIADKHLWTIQNQKCVFFIERPNEILPPKSKPNHITIFLNGNYTQKPEVAFCLSSMLRSMKCNSKARSLEFDKDVAKQKLMDAMNRIDVDFKCGCDRHHCAEKLQLFGPNSMSPDRTFDNIGYSDEKQVITMVVKAHNTTIKTNSVPIKASTQVRWTSILTHNMFKNTVDRIAQLHKLDNYISEKQQQYIDRFEKEKLSLKKRYKASLQIKRIAQKDICFTCKSLMYFGDHKGIFREKNNGRKVSPDRVDDANVFYDNDNFNLVCCSCNFIGKHNIRTHIESKAENVPVDLTTHLLQQCKNWLV